MYSKKKLALIGTVFKALSTFHVVFSPFKKEKQKPYIIRCKANADKQTKKMEYGCSSNPTYSIPGDKLSAHAKSTPCSNAIVNTIFHLFFMIPGNSFIVLFMAQDMQARWLLSLGTFEISLF